MKKRTAHAYHLIARRRLLPCGQTFLGFFAACLLAACEASSQGTDLASVSADMTVVADLAAGPSCGKIVLCTIQCGLGKLECSAQCAAGANATEAMKAGALALCAVLHCAGGDAGTGLPAILGCLLTSCRSEVAGCDGLPLL